MSFLWAAALTPWLLVPTALGLKSIPALEEATTSTPHILPFPCGFSLCQLVLLALNSFSTVHIPNWGGGQSNSAILKSWQYPKCICYQLPAPTPLLTILGFKMPNSVFFFFPHLVKTHAHTSTHVFLGWNHKCQVSAWKACLWLVVHAPKLRLWMEMLTGH